MNIGPFILVFLGLLVVLIGLAALLVRGPRARLVLWILAALMAVLAIIFAVFNHSAEQAHTCLDQGGELVDGVCITADETNSL